MCVCVCVCVCVCFGYPDKCTGWYNGLLKVLGWNEAGPTSAGPATQTVRLLSMHTVRVSVSQNALQVCSGNAVSGFRDTSSPHY